MNVTWSREAGENLSEIEEFIARDSMERAIRFVDALVDHTEEILADNPRSGRSVPETGNPDIRELMYHGYRVVYRLNNESIEVVTIFEGHRLLRLSVLSTDLEKLRT
jgi:plasmid stabilization system protein ParE